VDLDRTVISAPISGVVISRKVDAGQTVAASFNTPEMFTIANDLTKMQIEAAVSEADVGGVVEGQKVNFTVDAFPGRPFVGQVQQVRFAAITNQNVVTYTTVVAVDNHDLKLRPGMTANVSIITASRTNVLRVPAAALRFRPPEGTVIGSTNDTVAKAAGAPAAPAGKSGKPVELATSGPFAGLPIPPWQAGGERRRPTDQERTEYEASLTAEQKAKYQQVIAEMRARFAQMQGGGGGGGMGGGSAKAAAPEGPAIRTIFVVDKERSAPGKPVLQAVTVKTGISDGTSTEVSEGLKDGDVIVTGVISATATTTPPVSSPFGSPFGGGRR
jgi:HlyD family secretion protein